MQNNRLFPSPREILDPPMRGGCTMVTVLVRYNFSYSGFLVHHKYNYDSIFRCQTQFDVSLHGDRFNITFQICTTYQLTNTNI